RRSGPTRSSSVLPDATPLLRLFARKRLGRLDREDAVAMQRRQLMRLLRRAADTRFGRDHGFERIRDIAEFQQRVPLRRYEDFWRDYWSHDFPVVIDASWPGKIPFFAKTSGTSTGDSKYIPVTGGILRGNRRAV